MDDKKSIEIFKMLVEGKKFRYKPESKVFYFHPFNENFNQSFTVANSNNQHGTGILPLDIDYKEGKYTILMEDDGNGKGPNEYTVNNITFPLSESSIAIELVNSSGYKLHLREFE